MSYFALGNQGWSRDSIARFDYELPPGDYTMKILLRCDNKYPYKNISLAWFESDSTGLQLNRKVDYHMIDDQGYWKGISLAASRDIEFFIQKEIKIENSVRRHLDIAHLMQDSILPEIKYVGISIEKK